MKLMFLIIETYIYREKIKLVLMILLFYINFVLLFKICHILLVLNIEAIVFWLLAFQVYSLHQFIFVEA